MKRVKQMGKLIFRRVVGDSMQPTLRPGQVVIGSNLLSPKLGSVVIARRNGKELIKRIASIGLDGVEIRGDNAYDSHDSRSFGLIPASDIVATVIQL